MRALFASKQEKPQVESQYTGIAPTPALVQHRFQAMKINLIDIHPVRPWLLFNDKASNQVYLYDYEQADVLHSFSIPQIFEQRKEEIQLLRILERNYNGVNLPDWYQNELSLFQAATVGNDAAAASSQAQAAQAAASSGELKGLRLFDEEIVHWKLNFEKERGNMVQQQGIVKSSANNLKTLASVGKRLTMTSIMQQQVFNAVNGQQDAVAAAASPTPNGSAASAQAASNSKKKVKFVANRAPKCIVLHLEQRLVMLRYDEVSSSIFVFDELKHTQLENKTITCMEFIYTQPIVAVGCSDGSIRLWNYADKQVMKKVIPAHLKPVQKMICVHVRYTLFF